MESHPLTIWHSFEKRLLHILIIVTLSIDPVISPITSLPLSFSKFITSFVLLAKIFFFNMAKNSSTGINSVAYESKNIHDHLLPFKHSWTLHEKWIIIHNKAYFVIIQPYNLSHTVNKWSIYWINERDVIVSFLRPVMFTSFKQIALTTLILPFSIIVGRLAGVPFRNYE